MSTVIESDWENTRLKEEIESLRQQLEMAEACLAGDNALIAGLKNDIAEKDAEIKRLKYAAENPNFKGRFDTWQEVAGKYRGEAEDLTKQLSASQAREQQLREALEKLSLYVAYNGDDWVKLRAKEALALPTDTTALQSMIAKAGEVMRDRVLCLRNAHLISSEKVRNLPPITLKDLE